jgi:hypothetical protein
MLMENLHKKTFFTSTETLYKLRDYYYNNDSISYCKFKYNSVSTELNNKLQILDKNNYILKAFIIYR